MSKVLFGTSTVRSNRSAVWSVVAVVAMAVALMVSFSVLTSPSTSAATAHRAAPLALKAHATDTRTCIETLSTGPGTVVTTPAGSEIVGVVAGTSVVKIDCNQSSGAVYGVEASLTGTILTTSVLQTNTADIGTLASFAVDPSDTGCPAAMAGQCTVASFAVPANFSASDANSKCPPTQAEINIGLTGCAVAIVTGALKPVPNTGIIMTYASQTTQPTAPTISASPTTGPAGSSITVSDALLGTGKWWANANQFVQSAALGTAGLATPSTCGTGGGYGNVPTSLLGVQWFAAGSTTPIAGDASGVTISNDCYDGTALFGPKLGGTIPVPASVVAGTVYTVYLCEINFTSYPSNDTGNATNCGTAPAGASWVDASFSFTAAAGGATTTTTAPTTTTTEAPTTTTTAPTTTTTTKPAPAGPKANKVSGAATRGKTVTLTISGSGFVAGTRVSGAAGTSVKISSLAKNKIVIKVTVKATAKKGTFSFKVSNANGSSSVRYTVK